MNLEEQFNRLSLTEIDEFIASGQEEHLSLEFKQVNFPDYNNENKEYDKKNYAKALSGFANSQGGIIVWGIKASLNEEKQDVAKEKKPIKQLKKFLNLLNKLEGEAISPIVVGVKHKIITEGEDTGYGVTFVPPSDTPPHMALFGESHYYKRSGDSFYKCEHFDIRDMFFRTKTPKLSFFVREPFEYSKNNKNHTFHIKFGISNESNAMCRFPHLQVSINSPYCFYLFGLDGSRSVGLVLNQRSGLHRSYSSDGGIVIHSGMDHLVDIIEIELPIGDEIPDLEIEYVLVAEGMPVLKKTEVYPIKVLK